jgi:phenylacetate-CoA ligase
MSGMVLPDRAEPYFDREYETMPRPRLAELQFELLRETIDLAYERSPLVRETWDAAHVRPADVRSIDDFHEKVPFISKDDVRRFRDDRGDPYGGVLCLDRADLTAIMSTSGTTGDPTLTAERWGWSAAGRPALMFRDFWGMGVRPGDHCALFLFTFRGPTYGFLQALGCTPILFDYGIDEVERLLRLSLQYRPTAIYNFGGTMINATADVAEACGIDPRDAFSSYRAVVWAGEPLGARARGHATDWNLPLFEHSNVADVTACFECSSHDGMHVWEDTVLVEGISPAAVDHVEATTATVDDDRCELVATALVNRVAPLVRYRSDDIVRLDRRPCACGRTHSRLHTLGRKSDETLVDGRAVLPLDVWAAVESVDECRLGLFQIIRPAREVDVLRLRVGHEPADGQRRAGLRDEIVAAVQAAIGITPDVELVHNEELLRLGPPHKIPRVSTR